MFVSNMSVAYQARVAVKLNKQDKQALQKELADLRKELSEPKEKFRIALETLVSVLLIRNARSGKILR